MRPSFRTSLMLDDVRRTIVALTHKLRFWESEYLVGMEGSFETGPLLAAGSQAWELGLP